MTLCDSCEGELEFGRNLAGPKGWLHEVEWSFCKKCHRFVVEELIEEEDFEAEEKPE